MGTPSPATMIAQVSRSRGCSVDVNEVRAAPFSVAAPLRRAASTATRPRTAVMPTPNRVPARAVLVRIERPCAR